MSSEIAERLASVNDRIAAAALRSGRRPNDVRLVAVSKTQPPEAILEALEAGATELGENRAQELKQKFAVLGTPAVWHFVGHLQTNKARHVVGIADLIHSVDRYGVAEAIATQAHFLHRRQEVLLEVNVSGEASKHGVEPARLPALAREVSSLGAISVVGLMAMAPRSSDPEDSRPFFADLRELGEELRTVFPLAHHLSMGMTQDFEIAIEEGATIVRVGEAIFGPRN
ncbi:MAG: dependent protein [Actinomycetota bacterium]|nr:dependent protein [Actinomycetota bacterium]